MSDAEIESVDSHPPNPAMHGTVVNDAPHLLPATFDNLGVIPSGHLDLHSVVDSIREDELRNVAHAMASATQHYIGFYDSARTVVDLVREILDKFKAP